LRSRLFPASRPRAGFPRCLATLMPFLLIHAEPDNRRPGFKPFPAAGICQPGCISRGGSRGTEDKRDGARDRGNYEAYPDGTQAPGRRKQGTCLLAPSGWSNRPEDRGFEPPEGVTTQPH